MTSEDVKLGLDRLAAGVVARPDPYGRLMRRSRRRRVRRISAWTGGLAAVVAAGLALGITPRVGAVDPAVPQWPVTTEWTRGLIAAPTRGGLAGDSALVAGLVAETDRLAPGLPRTKVLFVDDIGSDRVAAVVHYSDTQASMDTYVGSRGASAHELAQNGTLNMTLTPVVVLAGDRPADRRWTVVLAPDGCHIATSSAVGAAERTWSAASSEPWLVAETSAPPYVQVTCGGVVRQQGPTNSVVDVADVAVTGTRTQPERGSAAESTVSFAVGAFDSLGTSAARSGPARVLWAGGLPGRPELGEAVLVASASGSGPALLWVGSSGKAYVALVGAADGSDAAAPPDRSLVATALVAGNATAVRIPRWSNSGAALSDSVLLVGPQSATRAEATDSGGRSVAVTELTAGVGTLGPLAFGAVTITFTDSGGAVVATASLSEPASGQRLFDESLIEAW